MGRLFTELTEEKLDQIRTHPYFAKRIEAIKVKAEKFLIVPPPQLKFSELHMYAVTGDRGIYQSRYSNVKDRMETFFFMYLLTKDDKYITPLADAIWYVCDIETWTIPAHVKETESMPTRRTFLDLCSTIMGFRMAEILYFVGDKLPDLVRKRMKFELQERIIDSYAKNTFWWMSSTTNWAAVCIGAVLSTYLYAATKEEIDAQLPRMLETIKCYLRGFSDDGCCLEGYGYWTYGFSHFCLFASMLRDYTDGKINLFDDPKVHKIALFQQNITMNSHECISFSDGGGDFAPDAWLSHFLKHQYPDMELPTIPPTSSAATPLRYLVWVDPDLAVSELNPKSCIFHDAQWFIHRSPAYNLAVKAGYNNEPHNHNDIGSFIISKNDNVTFTDPGGAQYTRQYFSSERYDILAPSSRAHSVPIINGQLQVTGNVRSTIFTEEPTRYAFSMENGYNIETLKSLKRDVNCLEDHCEITDTYEFTEEPTSIVERFSSYKEMVLTPEGIKCGDSLLVFDRDLYDVSFSEEENVKSYTFKPMVHFCDLKVKNPTKNTVIQVKIY